MKKRTRFIAETVREVGEEMREGCLQGQATLTRIYGPPIAVAVMNERGR